MINNEILRRLRYTFDLNDDKMIGIFKKGGLETSREQICNWLRKDEDSDFQPIKDVETAIFLNGFIVEKRGPKDGPSPDAEKYLTNNLVLRKLKIALNLKDSDILEIMEIAEFRIGKHELSALFRKSGHKHYRECKDQFLRNFLSGLQIKNRPNLEK